MAASAGDGNYNPATGSGGIVIAPASLTVTADDKSKVAGEVHPVLTASYSGFVHGEVLATSGVTGAPALSTTATISSPAGTYPITIGTGTLAALNTRSRSCRAP